MYSCIVSVLISVQMCFQLRLACTNSVHSIHGSSGSGGIKGSPFVFRMVAEQPGSFESLNQATLR